VDLDGTLLDNRGRLSFRNRDALHRAQEAGIAVCLCTGRSLNESRAVLDEIGLDLTAGVFVFGALVADPASGEVLARTPLPGELADRFIAHLWSRGHCVLLLYEAPQAGCDYVLLEGQDNRAAYERWLSLTPTPVERISRWKTRERPPLRINIIEQADRLEETLRELGEAFPPEQAKINSIYAPNYGFHVVECFSPMVNKWYGILQVAGKLAIEPANIVAIGDDINDLEMVAGAGLGVSVANAIPPIREVAALQAPSNGDDGVAWLIDRLLADSGAGPPETGRCRPTGP